MKYPQLVSPRAVNAISDWLVSRLEQLGVESPQIYTRLLLSLLQSSVQVNDPIEFSNLETFFSNRKGGHKRFHLPSDTETLKKLNAVQCLREIVSNEQENATIEQLVDELCEKLNDIEKETQNLSDEERFLIETHLNTDSLLQANNNSRQQQQQQQPKICNNGSSIQHHSRQNQQQQQVQRNCNNSNNTTVCKDLRRHVSNSATSTADSVTDIDNDPKKRYFRAFPALSKEMEDSFRVWRRNAKSLTWPIVGRSSVADKCNNINNSASISSSSASSTVSSLNFENSVSTDKIVEKKLLEGITKTNIANSSCGSNIGGDVQEQGGTVAAATSVKKKSKRRRNQALCKGKNMQSIRKSSVGNASNSSGGNKYHHYTNYRNTNTSPTWDTDFKGCWEMGPDLIKEFLASQKDHKSNRSSSESMDHEEHSECKILNKIPMAENKSKTEHYIDLSFCCDNDENDTQRHNTEEVVDYVDEDYDDNTLASVSEMTMDSINAKRLYQRKGHFPNYNVPCDVVVGNIDDDNAPEETLNNVDALDFQQLKAKFNSSVEALWKGVAPTPTTITQQPMMTQINGSSSKINPLSSISSAFYATTSLNALAPFKKDLWNFWSNYNDQHYDQLANKLSTTASTSSMITTRLDESSASSGAGADFANSSDYFSMPSNLDDFDKSVGSLRRTIEAGASLGAHTPSINIFLQNSIWSTSGDCVNAIDTSTAVDAEENFPFKVWHSNKKLSQLDVGNPNNGEKMQIFVGDVDSGDNNFIKSIESTMLNNTNLGANLPFPPFQNLKWSEGINAGPSYNGLNSHANASIIEMDPLISISSFRKENNFATLNSAANISGATWEAPSYGQNAQPDLKSWCASNPISLTEMYGNDVCDSIINQSPEEDQNENQSNIIIGPVVTLPNHSATTSGFISYARIKQCGIIQPQPKILPNSSASRMPKDFFKNTEEENLLTSERTHFHPIENFADGHTFDINNALDTVEFERTGSGLMRYESEEYLEYTRSDIYVADEEVATNGTNLLKYGIVTNEDKDDSFIIKFRFKRTGEIGCQTNERDLQFAAAKTVELPATSNTSGSSYLSPVEITNMFRNKISLSRQAGNEAIMAAVTKTVAAAAKAKADNHLSADHFSWVAASNSATAAMSTIKTNPLWVPEAHLCDEVDFCKKDTLNFQNVSATAGVIGQQQLAQNWSMQVVEKECHQKQCFLQKGAFSSSVDMERDEGISLDNTSLHTLWGMCAVCNSCEYGKSLPANRLLRDELQVEADEIMSDLRYMQDLYIGESDNLTETNENNAEVTVSGDKMDYDISKKVENAMNCQWITKNKRKDQHDFVQVSMLQKVNQLIENLLKPDISGKLSRDKGEHNKSLNDTEFINVSYSKDDKITTKNMLQYTNDEDNNIWYHKPAIENCEGKIGEKDKIFIKPMKLLKEVGGSFDEDLQYWETLSWEHDNLAKIWQQNIPTSTQIEEALIKQKQKEMANSINNKYLQQDQESTESSQKFVEERNLKNLQKLSALTPQSTVSSHTYERVQQFFNASAAKLKLVANRKRRHSASQNYFQQQNLQYSNKNDNSEYNYTYNITDLNACKQELKYSIKAPREQQQHQEQLKVTPCKSTITLGEQPTQQTIITCKYWTTATNGSENSLDSAATAMMLLAAATNTNRSNDVITIADTYDLMPEENVFSNNFSCLSDNNASMLKQMTMMTRPLTR